jgi:hypothetical protein
MTEDAGSAYNAHRYRCPTRGRGGAQPEPGPAPDFADVYASARTVQRVDNSDFEDRLTERTYRPVIDAVNAWNRANGEYRDFGSPHEGISARASMTGATSGYGAAFAAKIGKDAAIAEIWADVARIRKGQSGFP